MAISDQLVVDMIVFVKRNFIIFVAVHFVLKSTAGSDRMVERELWFVHILYAVAWKPATVWLKLSTVVASKCKSHQNVC